MRTCSVAVPGTSRNSNSDNREPTGDRSLDDPCPKARFSSHHSVNLNSSEVEEYPHNPLDNNIQGPKNIKNLNFKDFLRSMLLWWFRINWKEKDVWLTTIEVLARNCDLKIWMKKSYGLSIKLVRTQFQGFFVPILEPQGPNFFKHPKLSNFWCCMCFFWYFHCCYNYSSIIFFHRVNFLFRTEPEGSSAVFWLIKLFNNDY